MAKTARKKNQRGRDMARGAGGQPAPHAELSVNANNELQVKGGALVVRLARDSHPVVFDVDRLCKTIRKTIEVYSRRRECTDLCEFLQETDKGLQIILRNHLEAAMRKYLQ